MKAKKILILIILTSFVLSLSGCGTIDMMVGLKNQDGSKEFSDLENIDDIIANSGGDSIIDNLEDEGHEENNQDEEKSQAIAYYLDENKYITPVAIDLEATENKETAVLEQMVVGCEVETELSHSGFAGVLPEGTKILGLSVEGGLCQVDFSREILDNASLEQEEKMVSAITYTLTEFSGINNVEILVDGRRITTLANGFPLNEAYERENINLVGKEDGVNYVVFYKTHETEVEGHYVPFTFSAENVGNLASIAVDKLFNGPLEELNVSNNIPVGISLNKTSISNGVAYVDLSMEALNIEQEEYEEVKEIVSLCLQQFGEIKDVEFSIEGITFEEAGLDIIDQEIVPVFSNVK